MTTPRIVGKRCFLYSYKQGLLARLAHDLQLEVRRIELETGEDGLPKRARFFPDSIVLVGLLDRGVLRTDAFSDGDRAKILASLRDDVLAIAEYPEVTFVFETITPRGEAFHVRGALTLHGRTRPLEVTSRREGDRQIAEIVLHQPDFGIVPFTAMLGALKVKPDVLVRVEMWLS